MQSEGESSDTLLRPQIPILSIKMTPKLLITGATGYIGGTVLNHLQTSTDPPIKALTLSALVRSNSQAENLAITGVNPILFKDLDDTKTLVEAASQHDVVIHTASWGHVESARSLIHGLAQRKKQTGREVYYIHTSGTSNLGGHPITKPEEIEDRVFSDTEDMYSYLKLRESKEKYDQRTADIAVVEAGLAEGVQTYILMSPTIYGFGTGLFNPLSIQIPTFMRSAIKSRHAEVIAGSENAIWDHVHVSDLANLYELLISKLLRDDASVPSGERGIFFTDAGEHSWGDVMKAIGRAGFALGVLDDTEPVPLDLEDAAERWTGVKGNAHLAEVGFASK